MTAPENPPGVVTPLAAASGYFAHVDGLRAFAVLAVMLYHLSPTALPGGFVGVDVFFVISGYVVTASLAGHRSEGPGPFLGRFYARRLARIVPALATMLVVTTTLHVLFVPKAWFNRAAETVGQAAFWGLSNWTLERQVINYFEPRAELNPFTHTWSLGVEEQFYFVAPLFLFAALGSRFAPRRRSLAVIAIVTLAVLSFLACHYFGLTRGPRFVFYQLTFRFWELACGVILFLLGSRCAALPHSARRFYRISGWLGLGLVIVAMCVPKPGAYPWIRATLAVLGTVLLIGLPLIERRDRLQCLLASRGPVWIGRRSYALYLWHWPIYVLARWTTGLNVWPFGAAAVGLSFAMAAASYRWIESPVRYSATLRKWHPLWRISAFALLLGLGWWAGRTLLQAQPVLGLGRATRQAADWYADRQLLKSALAASRRCDPIVQRGRLGDLEEGLTAFIPEGCERKTESQLFVLGDSHAVAYLPMLEQLSAEQGKTVTVLQVPGCAYIDMMAPMDPALDGHCFRMAQASMGVVLKQSRPGDIVFMPSLRVPRLIALGGSKRGATEDARGAPQDTYSRTSAELVSIDSATRDAPRWFVPFLEAGLQVLFELPKPILRSHPFYCVDWFNRQNPDCAGGLIETQADQERYRAPIVAAVRRLSSEYQGVSAWDPLPALCNEVLCPALRDGRPLFFDGDHLSPYGNLVLLPAFRTVVRGLETR